MIDLHGNSKKKERAPDGTKDENVFDIQQGVAIGLFIKRVRGKAKPAIVRHADLWGVRIIVEGKILDGRNRYRACCKAGIEPTFRDFGRDKDGDPRAFVIGMNVHRRHLTESERAVIVIRSAIRGQVESTADARMKAGTAADPSTPESQGVGKTSEMLGRVAGVGAGLHLVTHLTRSAPATKVIATARDAGIWLDEWQQFEARDKRTEGLVFGYGAIESTRIAEAVRRLSKLMK